MSRGPAATGAGGGRLQAAARSIRNETGLLTEIGGRLFAILSEGGEVSRERLAEDVSLPLARCLKTGSPRAGLWANVLAVESPAARRALKAVLLRELMGRGVCRDTTELGDVTGCGVGGLLAAVATRTDQRSAKAIVTHVEGIAKTGGRGPSPSDAALLGFLARKTELDALWGAAAGGGAFADCLELSSWLGSMEGDRGASSPPDSALTRAWFASRAFRGARRRWARRRGLDAGSRGARALETWIAAWGEDLPESYGVMVVEWALAAIRSWPDRERMVHEDCPELGGLASGFAARAGEVLGACRGAPALREWLDSGVRSLTATPAPERRLRRGRSPSRRESR